MLIDGLASAKEIRNQIKEEIATFDTNQKPPGLGIVMVGDRVDSATYVRMKKRACNEVGIYHEEVRLSENVSQEILLEKIHSLNKNPSIHGILIQLPLPSHIDTNKVLKSVSREKDVDGFHPENVGNLTLNRLEDVLMPCTPKGCIELLDKYNIQIEGKHAVVIGKSAIVGMPLSLLLLHREATVSVCHIKTQNIKAITRQADILISACGQAEMIKADWIKEGCVVIDVGINSVNDANSKRGYKIVGDVDFADVREKVSAITPVPGGVGPMTIAMLLKNTVSAFKSQSQS
jgi:5,10-methylene-tetrahydrofolate dehydrogenase/methenyl tetrahydrofolate cyclohydrolase